MCREASRALGTRRAAAEKLAQPRRSGVGDRGTSNWLRRHRPTRRAIRSSWESYSQAKGDRQCRHATRRRRPLAPPSGRSSTRCSPTVRAIRDRSRTRIACAPHRLLPTRRRMPSFRLAPIALAAIAVAAFLAYSSADFQGGGNGSVAPSVDALPGNPPALVSVPPKQKKQRAQMPAKVETVAYRATRPATRSSNPPKAPAVKAPPANQTTPEAPPRRPMRSPVSRSSCRSFRSTSASSRSEARPEYGGGGLPGRLRQGSGSRRRSTLARGEPRDPHLRTPVPRKPCAAGGSY